MRKHFPQLEEKKKSFCFCFFLLNERLESLFQCSWTQKASPDEKSLGFHSVFTYSIGMIGKKGLGTFTLTPRRRVGTTARKVGQQTLLTSNTDTWWKKEDALVDAKKRLINGANVPIAYEFLCKHLNRNMVLSCNGWFLSTWSDSICSDGPFFSLADGCCRY